MKPSIRGKFILLNFLPTRISKDANKNITSESPGVYTYIDGSKLFAQS